MKCSICKATPSSKKDELLRDYVCRLWCSGTAFEELQVRETVKKYLELLIVILRKIFIVNC